MYCTDAIRRRSLTQGIYNVYNWKNTKFVNSCYICIWGKQGLNKLYIIKYTITTQMALYVWLQGPLCFALTNIKMKFVCVHVVLHTGHVFVHTTLHTSLVLIYCCFSLSPTLNCAYWPHHHHFDSVVSSVFWRLLLDVLEESFRLNPSERTSTIQCKKNMSCHTQKHNIYIHMLLLIFL